MSDVREFYHLYLTSDWWKQNKQPAMSRADGKCECCGSMVNLQPHHLTYAHKYEEMLHPEDLIVLCGNCHEWIHARGGTHLGVEGQRRLLAEHSARLKGERVYGKKDFIQQCLKADYSAGGTWNLTDRNQINDFYEEYCEETGWNGCYAVVADTQRAIAFQRYPIIFGLIDQGLTNDEIVAKTHFSSTMVQKLRNDPQKYRGYLEHERSNHSTD